MKNIARFFEQEEKKILQQTEKFYKILTHLRYEGKVSFGKNLKAAREAAGELESKLKKHKDLQEKILFRFIETHIPRKEATIHLFETEHDEITENQKKFKVSLKRLSKKPGCHTENGSVCQAGIYLVALLRHHIKFENRSLYKTLQKELRQDEKRKISLRVKKWFIKNNNAFEVK